MTAVLVVFVLLNVLWRAVRMGVGFPLWGDEAMLALSFQVRDPAGLVRPLLWAQLAPPGFLWLVGWTGRSAGFAEWSLRIWPAAAGTLAIVGFAWTCRRFLRPREAVLAVAVLCVSYYPLRHSVEVKPYAVDLLAGVVLPGLALCLDARRRTGRQTVGVWTLWAATGAGFVWVSFPSAFVLAATGLWMGWRELLPPRRNTGILAGLAAGLVVGASFAGMYGVYQEVKGEELDKYRDMTYWDGAFPPVERPWAVPGWLLEVHAGRMSAYPVGDKNFASAGSLIVMVAGGFVLWRGRRRLLMLVTLPLLIGMAAAAFQVYPYGTTVRTMLYAAPGQLVLLGVGGSWLVGRVRATRRPVVLRIASGVLILIGVAGLVRDVIQPYKLRDDRIARDVVARLATEDGPSAVWVFPIAAVYPSSGEPFLTTDSLGPVMQFYVQRDFTGQIRYAPPPTDPAPPTARVRVIVSDSRYDPPLTQTLAPYAAALTPVRGEPSVQSHPLKIGGRLHVYTWPSLSASD